MAESEKGYLIKLHQNAQRLLRPLKVVNPFAHQLTFLSDKTRTRRDHMKYLTLIQSIALLHQYQREVKRAEHRGEVIEYIEVTKGDIALANQLAHEVLGRTLDEMPPQTRKLLVLLKDWVSIRALAAVHESTHPAEWLEGDYEEVGLLAELSAEDEEVGLLADLAAQEESTELPDSLKS